MRSSHPHSSAPLTRHLGRSQYISTLCSHHRGHPAYRLKTPVTDRGATGGGVRRCVKIHGGRCASGQCLDNAVPRACERTLLTCRAHTGRFVAVKSTTPDRGAQSKRRKQMRRARDELLPAAYHPYKVSYLCVVPVRPPPNDTGASRSPKAVNLLLTNATAVLRSPNTRHGLAFPLTRTPPHCA